MNISPRPACVVPAARLSLLVFKKYFNVGILLGLLLTLGVTRLEAQDDDYMAIYAVIDQADALNTGGKTAEAHNKYIEAKQALADFKQNNPSWNTATVNFRLKYLDEKIADTAATIPVAASDASSASHPSAAFHKKPAGTLTLIDAGSEPRKILSLHPTVGDKQAVNVTVKMSMATTMAGNAMPAAKIPAVQMTMGVEVKNVAADGEVTYAMNFSDATMATDPNAPATAVAAMQGALAGMKGVTGTGKVSTNGIMGDVQMKLPPGATVQARQFADQMKESMSGSFIPLPAEAVGPGAKWEYKSKNKSQGMIIDETDDYELVSVDGDQAVVRSTLTQSAANQMIENPALPGMKMNVTQLVGTGTGSITLNLGQLMPLKATTDVDTDTSMTLNMGQQPQPMEVKMKMSVTMESK